MTQLRVTADGGIIGYDYTAIYLMAESYHIDIDAITMDKIQYFERLMIRKGASEREKQHRI